MINILTKMKKAIKIMKKQNDVVETYYENGQLRSRANYKSGNLDGLWEEWYSNGKPMEE